MKTETETSASAFPTFRAIPRWIGRLCLRIWRKIWRPIVVVLAVLIAAHLVLNIIAGRRLEAELSRLRAEGAPLTLAQAAPPAVPDSENAATLYLRAFWELGLTPSPTAFEFSDAERAELRRPRAAKRLAAINERSRVARDEDEVIRGFLGPDYPEPAERRYQSRATLAEVEPIIARHQAAFRLLRQASMRPACHFPVDWSAGPTAVFYHLRWIRMATRFLAAKAIVDATHQRSGDALDDLAIAVRMGNHISAEPVLISQLVRHASIVILFHALPRVMAAAPPDPAQSRAFYALLAKVDLTQPWVRAMEGERCNTCLWIFDQLRHAKSGEVAISVLGIAQEMGFGSRAVVPAALRFCLRHAWPLARVIWMPFLSLDEVVCLRGWQQVVALAAKPYRETLSDQERLERAELPWYAVVSPAGSPVYVRASSGRDGAIAEIGLMQAALALRAYQAEHGAYPASLADLRAAGGWAIPDDPFSGKPFIYRREGAGYFIYSLGLDLKDNGGMDEATALELAAKLSRLPRKGKAAETAPGPVQYDIPLRMTR
jgi:hypothetical protein